jgi:beta-lactamase superfamily II metal-dependent hydrolase
MPNFYILDVAHGNSAILIDTKGVVVIDAGGSKPYLLDFLTKKNISTIDVLLLSHADQDHIAGAIGLLSSEILVKSVYVNPDSTKTSKIWDDLVYLLCERHKEGHLHFEVNLTPNLNGKLDQGQVIIEVLAPNQYLVAKGSGSKDRKGSTLTTNSISAVIRLSHKGKHVALLPGDIDETGLDNLLKNTDNIQAWLMVFPHHGGKPGGKNVKRFTRRFCKSVKPKIVIFSIGDNTKNFPTQVVVETVAETLDNVRMFSTRSSEVLKTHIKKTVNESHQNGVGTVHLDFSQEPLDVDFINDSQAIVGVC